MTTRRALANVVEALEGRQLLSAAPRIVGVYPDNRGMVELRADQALDASTVNASSVKIYTAGADGAFGTSDDALASAVVSYEAGVNGIRARAALSAGTAYRVAVSGSVVRAAGGGALLDGEYLAAGQASGNGVAGGDFDMVAQASSAKVARYVTPLGTMMVTLDAQAAPQTVANFEVYANAGDWDGTIFHRSEPGFVIQGGGFKVTAGNMVGDVSQRPVVVNEPGRSNLRGTIAMAKQDGLVNSATNQWFFNLDDNLPLNVQNGGFTVFGAVEGDENLAVMDAISALDRRNANGGDPDGPFGSLPVLDGTVVDTRPNPNYDPGDPSSSPTGYISPQDDLVIVSRVAMLMDAAPTPAGDMTLELGAIAGTAAPGAQTGVAVTLRNDGPGGVSGTASVGLWLSSDETIDDGDTLVAWTGVNVALAAGGSVSQTFNFTVPAGTAAGQYFVLGRADLAGTGLETNTGNNGAGTGITVAEVSEPEPPPVDQPPTNPDPQPQPPSQPQTGDLVVSVMNLSGTTFVPGGRGTITVVIQNASGTAVNGTANVGLYLSGDSVFDGGDSGLIFSQVPVSLGGGEGTQVTLEFTVPKTATAGDYHLVAAANADGAIAENSLGNNTAAAGITVSAPTVGINVKGGGKVKRGKSTKVTLNLTSLANTPLSGNVNVTFTLTTDPNGAGGTVIGTKVMKMKKVKKGKSMALKMTVKVPKTIAQGLYYVGVRTDGTGLSEPMAQAVTVVSGGITVQ